MTVATLGLICCAAGGLEAVNERIVQPLLSLHWRVAVTLTPAAATWLLPTGELAQLEAATGLPVRSAPRLPSDARPHPPVDGYAVVPATANTVTKLAVGIADNQALTQLCEGLGAGLPIVVFPRINAAHARHPAWQHHINTLSSAGVHLVYGEDVWPLHEPRSQPERDLPWRTIQDTIVSRIKQR